MKLGMKRGMIIALGMGQDTRYDMSLCVGLHTQG
jgi:hypothetical protein